jgi:diguanylate cyclase (GGDEF)-like protein/PAS domain S-box-containing protein
LPDPPRGNDRDTPELDGVLDEIKDALLILDRGLRCLYLNARAAEILGRPADEILGRDVWELFPGATGAPLHGAYQRAMREQVDITIEDYFAPLDGWFETRLQPSPDRLTVLVRDVTPRKLVELELIRSERRHRLLTQELSTLVWETDAEGRPTKTPDSEALTGYPVGPDEQPGWRAIVHPDDSEGLAEAWQRSLATGATFDHNYRIRHATGRWVHLRVHGVPVWVEGRIAEWIGVVYDLSEQVAAADAMHRAAFEDPLTGLPNRALLVDRLDGVLARREGRAAVLYIDIDNFKSVNDRFGHNGGDALLVAVADRLRAGVRPSDVVSRLSGDEFAIICDNLHDEMEATAIAARVCSAIPVPLEIDGRIHASASIGISFVGGRPDEDAESVLSAADAAMYRAKARGGATIDVFDEDLRTRLQRRTLIEAELRAGLLDGGLNLHFQPIVALDGRRAGAESLLRWQRPGGPAIGAQDAVSVAEETGLIGQIGREVLASACTAAAGWSGVDVGVAVNVSPRQLTRPDELVADVRAALATSGLAAERLTLEITETVLMEDMRQGEQVLTRLRALGVRLEIDDFGVGYSSLSYLHRLPVQALKLDRSFIAGLPHDRASVRILEAVVGLARAFDVGVTAEGVETTEQLEAVRAAGCDAAQGYGLARPGPVEELPERLAAALAAVRA